MANITMGNNEWIGLGAGGGRIVFQTNASDIIKLTGMYLAEARETRDGSIEFRVLNDSTGGSAAAIISAWTQGDGDAFFRCFVGAADYWSFGLDNSDEDKFKINWGAALADPSDLELDSSGNLDLATGGVFKVSGTQVVGAQQLAEADVAAGAEDSDGACRAKLNALLAKLRTHGLIAT